MTDGELIIIIIIRMIMFMVLSSWQATSRVHPVHVTSVERRQEAADLVSLPVGCQRPHPPSQFIIITQPKS